MELSFRPWSIDDGADDDNGHGTHVAGSVLGDGTSSGGSVMGIAPEAQLLFHAFEQTDVLVVGFQTTIKTSLMLQLKMVAAYTPTLGAVALGQVNFHHVMITAWYNTGSMQIDMGAITHKQLVIMFANGNDADDGDGNGEIDDNSLLWEATAKNSISIGASENYRPSRGGSADNADGMADFSGRGPTEDGRIKPDFVAPGTHIYSTKSRETGPAASSCGWGSDSAETEYCFMGGNKYGNANRRRCNGIVARTFNRK